MPRRIMEGTVVSNKMDKTAVVSVARRVRHGKYLKTVVRHKHYMVHDEDNACNPGDRVIIAETRPMSRHKRWRLSRILEHAVQLGATRPRKPSPCLAANSGLMTWW